MDSSPRGGQGIGGANILRMPLIESTVGAPHSLEGAASVRGSSTGVLLAVT